MVVRRAGGGLEVELSKLPVEGRQQECSAAGRRGRRRHLVDVSGGPRADHGGGATPTWHRLGPGSQACRYFGPFLRIRWVLWCEFGMGGVKTNETE